MASEGEPGPSRPVPQRQGVKLFLGGLSWETSEEKIKKHFGRYGEILEAVVMRERFTDKPRGFGFVTFKEEAAAEQVCQEQHILDGRQIDAKRSVPPEQKVKSKKIFVGGLAPDTSEAEFRQYFEQYGRITEAQIMQDHLSGRSRGFGFVTYDDAAAVDRIFQAGSMHQLAGKKVEVKTATPRGTGPMGPTRIPGPAEMGALVAGRGATPFARQGSRPFREPLEGALMPPEAQQGGYPMAYGPAGMAAFGPGMMGAYQMGYQPPYGAYGGMMMGPYGYGYYGYPPAAAYQQVPRPEMQPGSPFMAPRLPTSRP